MLPNDHKKYLTKLANYFTPKVIYDIGACQLEWSNFTHQVWPSAIIVAFEAMKEFEPLYQKSPFLYHFGVLSDKISEVEFFQNTQHPTGSSYYQEINPSTKELYKPVKLHSNTLNNIIAEKKFPLPDLIKIDVQGAELDILRGASVPLKTTEHLLIELQHTNYNKDAPKRDTSIPFIEKLGFELIMPLFSYNGPDGDYHFQSSS